MMSAYPLPRRLRIRRKTLMLSCASAALAVVAISPRPAHAQAAPSGAFRGTIASQVGSVTRNPTTNTTETITIGSNTATINWSPTDTAVGGGAIDFLPTGNVATFTSTPGITDYTVLNRIVPNDPSRSILLDGTVLSTLEGTATTGGNIWFYSPGGIVIGSNAVFDVGGLLLTTADVLPGWTADASGFSASFAAGSGSTSAIQILDGARINALNQGSYVALIAPRIEQGGNVQVNGAAAYAAAEQLTMTMNQGLFDIQVDVGTSDAQGIVHSGTTGGPASTGAAADPHRIYMAAVPKNQALTMLLGGNIGFDSATVAGLENGQIVLSAGRSIYETSGSLGFGATGGTLASAHIRGAYSSNVTAVANDFLAAYSDEFGSTSFSGDVSLEAPTVHFVASNGHTLSVGGDVALWSAYSGPGEVLVLAQTGGAIDVAGDLTAFAQEAPGIGGDISVVADNGSVNIGGQTYLYADGIQSEVPAVETAAQSAYGGNVGVYAVNGGAITTGGLTLSADAVGQAAAGGGSDIAGSGYGGVIDVNANSGGTLSVNGNVHASAIGFGGDLVGTASQGGVGQGGGIYLGVGSGTVAVTGDVTADASGFGGSVADSGSGGPQTGGEAYGGYANINAFNSGGPGSITIGGETALIANAYGGDAQTGGNAHGGDAGVWAINGTITLGSSTYASAQAFGGSALFGYGGWGGFGQGGTAYIQADVELGNIEVPPSQGTIIGGDFLADVSAVGGVGGAGDGSTIAAGRGGDGIGGYYTGEQGSGGAFALAQDSGGTLQLGNVTMYSHGVGGTGGTGGAGQTGGLGGTGFGGSAQAGGYDGNGPGGTTGSATFGALYLDSSGFGGSGGAGEAGQGDGGYGYGGSSYLNAKGTLTADQVVMFAQGWGGGGTNGGYGVGGWAIVESYPAATLNFGTELAADASGWGGAGLFTGGDATGGTATITADSGTIAGSGTIVLATAATAGDASGAGGTGGSATGGENVLTASNGGAVNTTGFLNLNAAALGGDGTAQGGTARAGSSEILIDGGAVTAGSLGNYANAWGGTGLGEGAGGAAYGGYAAITFGANGGSFHSAGDAGVEASGFGGGASAGGAGGNGSGGTVNLDLTGGSDLQAGELWAFTTGTGGGSASGTGGDGDGGYGTLTVASGGSFDVDRFWLFSDGFGGSSLTGTGGSAYGGSADMTIDGGSVTIAIAGGVTGDAGAGSGATSGDAYAGSGTVSLTANGGSLSGGSLEVHAWGIATAGAAGGSGSNTHGGSGIFQTADVLNPGATASVDLVNLYVTADGDGGAGGDGAVGGNGGQGTGGYALLSLGSGTVNISNLLEVSTNGTGGSGGSGETGGAGGAGIGGSANISVTGATLNASGTLTASADGSGGAGGVGTTGASGDGGYGEAGDAEMLTYLGGIINAASLTASADALGGSGVNGGWADGGSVFVSAQSGDGHVNVSGLATLSAQATGGAGSTAGIGGEGYGGSAELSGVGGHTIVNDALISTSGTGGQGGTGGDGFGGSSVAGSRFGGLTVSNSLVENADGTGGAGLNGNGGNGEGGWSYLNANLLGDTAATATTIHDAVLSANGIGGSSGTSGAAAGSGVGGEVEMFGATELGTLTIDTLEADANGTGGAGSNGASGGTANGGFISVLAENDSANAGSGSVDVTHADLAANASGTNGGAGVIEVNSEGGRLSIDSATLTANGTLNDGIIFILADQGSGGQTGLLHFSSLDATAVGGAMSGGELTVSADGGSVVELGNAVLTGELVQVLAGGGSAATVEASQLTMTGDQMYLASSGGGDLRVSGDLRLNAGSFLGLFVDGAGSIQANLIDAHGDYILATTPLSGGTVTLNGGTIDVGDISATTLLSVNGTGDVVTGNLSSGGALSVGAGGSIEVGDVVAGGSATFAAGTDLFLNELTAGTSANLQAGGLASFTGTVSSPTITVTSGDIDVADGASLGVHGVTNLITLNATSDNIVLGDLPGDAVAEGYQLSEDGDISSTSVVFNGVGTGAGAPDINVYDADIEGSQTAGGGIAHLTVNTGGSIFVNGQIDFVNAAASDTLALNAGQRIEVITDNGGIAMTDSAGLVSGSLSLTAHDVWVASQAVLDQLETNINFDGRDAALASNTGAVNPGGYVQAGGIHVTMLGSSFIVQNSGTDTDFAGLSVGSGGLTITNQGNEPATVLLYGRKLAPDGTVTGNDDFAGAVTFTGSGGTTSDSQVNSCSVGGCGQVQQPELPPEIASANSAIGPLATSEDSQAGESDDADDNDEEEDSDSDGDSSTDASFHLINTGPLQGRDVIDEPITSGNDGPGGRP